MIQCIELAGFTAVVSASAAVCLPKSIVQSQLFALLGKYLATHHRLNIDMYWEANTEQLTLQTYQTYIQTTVVSHYYDTAGIRKKYHNIQTINLSSTNF